MSHCKDVRRKVLTRVPADDTSFPDAVLDGVLATPREACIDFSDVLAELAAADKGWLVIEAEQDPEKAPSPVYIQLGFVQLSAAAARAGLARQRR